MAARSFRWSLVPAARSLWFSKTHSGGRFRNSGVELSGHPPADHAFRPWTVNFDPKWGGPEKVVFDQLMDWTNRPEPGIKYYSGTAIYHQNI